MQRNWKCGPFPKKINQYKLVLSRARNFKLLKDFKATLSIIRRIKESCVKRIKEK